MYIYIYILPLCLNVSFFKQKLFSFRKFHLLIADLSACGNGGLFKYLKLLKKERKKDVCMNVYICVFA